MGELPDYQDSIVLPNKYKLWKGTLERPENGVHLAVKMLSYRTEIDTQYEIGSSEFHSDRTG